MGKQPTLSFMTRFPPGCTQKLIVHVLHPHALASSAPIILLINCHYYLLCFSVILFPLFSCLFSLLCVVDSQEKIFVVYY